jgi:hypothetical protein
MGCLPLLEVICSVDFVSALLLLDFVVLWILVSFHIYSIRICGMLTQLH